MNRSEWFADLAWVDGRPARDVRIRADGPLISDVETGSDGPPPDATHLPGVVVPGLANAHSHAFHRALRGRTERGRGDFWSWREQMYEVAGILDPDRYHGLARAVYAEMVLAGYTAVGEFHYLHHAPDGRPYDTPNAMGEALVAAARDAGIRLTLIDTCYLHGGPGREPLEGTQRRFSDGDVDAWAARAAGLDEGPGLRRAAGIHSVRAVDEAAIGGIAGFAADRVTPLHLHLSEQPAENDACVAATGRTPTQLVADAGALGERTTAVHATHLTADDVAIIGGHGTSVCLCPTTERALADGIGRSDLLVRAGAVLCLGSDSHAVIDPFEEARAVELDLRLETGTRGHHDPAELLAAATIGGMRSLGWDAGELAAGRRCDLVALDPGSPRLSGIQPDRLAAHVVFAATAADVTDVVVDAEHIVRQRHHTRVADVGEALRRALDELGELGEGPA